MDDRVVTEEAWSANFLIPPDEKVYGGKTIAEVCCDSLKEFNPMVRVSVEKGLPTLLCSCYFCYFYCNVVNIYRIDEYSAYIDFVYCLTIISATN